MSALAFGLLVAAFLLLIVGLGTGLAWMLGVFNPLGYLGVSPWRVPPEAWEAERARRAHHAAAATAPARFPPRGR